MPRGKHERVKEVIYRTGHRRQFEFDGVVYRFDCKPVLTVVPDGAPLHPAPEPCPETLAV